MRAPLRSVYQTFFGCRAGRCGGAVLLQRATRKLSAGGLMRTRTVLLAIALSVSITFLAQEVAKAAEETPEQQIQRITNEIPPAVTIEGRAVRYLTLQERMAELHVSGVSVAVVRDGRLAWARGFGVTQPGGAPVTANTRFIAGSISKPVTALAVLKLVQSGRLNLDVDANQYLKSWKIPDNGFTAQSKVTVRELLNHTGGVTVAGFGGYAYGTQLPTLLQILNGIAPANSPPTRVDLVPGTTWRYAGGGYVILRQLLMDVTGEPFEKLMQEIILEPLGMSHSTFEQPLTPALLADVAMPTALDGRAFKPRIYPEMAPDGLWTTASDLGRYIIGVQQALAGRRESVISQPTAEAMLTPGRNHWGLGPIVGDDERHPFFTFNGGNEGFVCLLVAYNHGDGAAIMTNSGRGYELAIDLVRSISQEYHWSDFGPIRRRTVASDAKTLDSFVGAYESLPGRLYVVSRKGSRMYVHESGQAKKPMFPVSERRFFLTDTRSTTYYPKDDQVEIGFDSDPAGHIATLTVYDNGVKTDGPAKRLEGAAARSVVDHMTALENRIKAQAPASGEKPLLRQLIAKLTEGRRPNYEQMTSRVASQIRSDAVGDQRIFSELGPLISISFEQVEPNGVDMYRLRFKNGGGVAQISLNEVGRIQYILYEQAQGG